jgi:hypothetical protein
MRVLKAGISDYRLFAMSPPLQAPTYRPVPAIVNTLELQQPILMACVTI